jgi:hypothetical protein
VPVPTDPYTFADGPGNTASGVQVNARFSPLYNALNPAVVGLDHQNVQANGLRESNLATGINGLARGSFSAYRNAALNAATGGTLVFDTEEWDISSWYAVGSGQFNPQAAGYYRLSWNVGSGGGLAAGQWWRATLYKNAAAIKRGMPSWQGAGVGASSPGDAIVQANGSSDFFYVVIDHNVGAATAVTVGQAETYFQGELIGRV